MRGAIGLAFNGLLIVAWFLFLAVAAIAAIVTISVGLVLATAWALDLTSGWWP